VSIDTAAAELIAEHPNLNVLINNAGMPPNAGELASSMQYGVGGGLRVAYRSDQGRRNRLRHAVENHDALA
jgi:hypothetical protein